ncbi:MAG TPA: VPDSG-CTERM sorting domain-containing protein [Verrucomicrobiota bacterium]|nr:hypothetical protein [Verrucomicrobiales bacterium]HRI11461.1 VPDSG-CTERM sorting domain-containing protein [Verrucomicrobiota bacterium]
MIPASLFVPTPFGKLTSLLTLTTLWIISSSVNSSAITWTFSASDGIDTISGTMATTGTQADLAAAGSFQIESILTLLLNDAPVALATAVPWSNGINASISQSPLLWSGSNVELPIFISAISNGGDNLEIDINPSQGGLRARIEGIVEFVPDSQSVVPIGVIPRTVPDSGSGAGLLAIALFGLASCKRRQDTHAGAN